MSPANLPVGCGLGPPLQRQASPERLPRLERCEFGATQHWALPDSPSELWRSAAVAGAGPATDTSTTSQAGESSQPASRPEPQRFGLGAHRADGNRLAAGSGSVPGSTPLETRLEGVPDRLVAARTSAGQPLLAVTLPDGTVRGFRVTGRGLGEQSLRGGPLDPGEPPLLDADADGKPALRGLPGAQPGAGIVADGQWLVAAGAEGSVVGSRAGASAPIATPPDSRPAIGDGTAVVVGGATDRYDHGVLGDATEGSELFALDPGGGGEKALTIDPPAVIEGAAPILTQLAGDPSPEVVLTISDAEQGARLVAYELGSSRRWSSEPIGSGQRWRHQIAVAPFGPDGELELASVRTPHLDGIVEFHAVESNRLVRRASLGGYSSHEIGSRNLDRAIAGDFDGSGRPELVVPSAEATALAGIERTEDGAEEIWRLELGAPLATNLAAVADRSGALLLAAGLADGRLLVWGG